MSLSREKKDLSASELRREALIARRKGKRKKAISIYREALSKEPEDPDSQIRLGRLLAERKKCDEAWGCFVKAAGGYHEKGFVEKAVGVYKQARQYVPTKIEVWQRLADLDVQRGRSADAVNNLYLGSRVFRRRKHRREARELLSQAFQIEPYRFEVTYDLAVLLFKYKEKGRARKMLDELARRTEGRDLRRVRGKLFWLGPTPAASWRYAKALFTGN
jgi:tetratricopeptide (TPR) repeat protein